MILINGDLSYLFYPVISIGSIILWFIIGFGKEEPKDKNDTL